MSTRRFDDGNDPSPNKRRIYAIVGIFLGVSLLFFSPPELLRARFGPVALVLAWGTLNVPCPLRLITNYRRLRFE
jgi:hypothetical protein